MRASERTIVLLMIIAALAFVASCGGDSSGGSGWAISYNGPTFPATIAADDGTDLLKQAYDSGGAAENATGAVNDVSVPDVDDIPQKPGASAGLGYADAMRAIKAIEGTLPPMNPQSGDRGGLFSLYLSFSNTENGNCNIPDSGTADLSVTASASTGTEMSIEGVYHDYCTVSAGIETVMNGSLKLTMKADDMNDPTWQTMSVTMNPVSIAIRNEGSPDNTSAMSIAGYQKARVDLGIVNGVYNTVTIDQFFIMRDDMLITNNTVKVDYDLEITQYENEEKAIASGLYYTPQGVYSISTVPWVNTLDGSDVPYWGSIRMTGADNNGLEYDFGLQQLRLNLDGDDLFGNGVVGPGLDEGPYNGVVWQ